MKHVCNTCLDQDICPDGKESEERNMTVEDCGEHKRRPVCTECATSMKRVGVTDVIFCPNCGEDNRADSDFTLYACPYCEETDYELDQTSVEKGELRAKCKKCQREIRG